MGPEAFKIVLHDDGPDSYGTCCHSNFSPATHSYGPAEKFLPQLMEEETQARPQMGWLNILAVG